VIQSGQRSLEGAGASGPRPFRAALTSSPLEPLCTSFLQRSAIAAVSIVTDSVVPTAAPRGRPRSERAHQAILHAANEILEERGFVDLTMDEVAQRAGVSKPTIYRRWPTKGTLVFEAFSADFLTRQPLPDTGSLRGDLLAALRAWIRVVKGTVTGRTLRGLIAEVQRDAELAEIWREQFTGPVRAQHRTMIDRAVERGEVSPSADPDVVLDLLYGSAYHRLLQSHLPLSDRFAQAVVDTVVAGVRPDQVGDGSSRRV
jgi:AcrR family transcriptional regulator